MLLSVASIIHIRHGGPTCHVQGMSVPGCKQMQAGELFIPRVPAAGAGSFSRPAL